MSAMSRAEFQALLEPVISYIDEKSLDTDLQNELNQEFPVGGDVLSSIKQACHNAITAGWMCKYEDNGIKYGRVIKPAPETGRFSVDVVQMQDIAGPHHRHPQGEIDLIMPLDATAEFDQHGEGWLVYGPETAHRPTVSNGAALVLYLLPDGKIEFTKE